MLAESLRIAHTAGALRTRNLKRVTVDTTVQPQAITFLTDAKLLHASIKGLLRLAKKHHVQLRQSYLRIAKHAVMMARRYAHVKQFKRQHRQLRLLRPRLDRLIRDIRPKIAGQTDLEKAFEWLLAYASQIRSQQAAPARVEASRPLCFCRFQLALPHTILHHPPAGLAKSVQISLFPLDDSSAKPYETAYTQGCYAGPDKSKFGCEK